MGGSTPEPMGKLHIFFLNFKQNTYKVFVVMVV